MVRGEWDGVEAEKSMRGVSISASGRRGLGGGDGLSCALIILEARTAEGSTERISSYRNKVWTTYHLVDNHRRHCQV